MENFEEPQQVPHEDAQHEPLVITEDIRSYIYETAKWTKFLAVIGFVVTGLLAICSFFAGGLMTYLASMNPMASGNSMAKMGGAFWTFYLLIIALLYFYPSFLMFKYANAAKRAVLFGDQLSLSMAMSKMKSFFKFWGILMIIMIAFYLIVILFVVVLGMSAASMGS